MRFTHKSCFVRILLLEIVFGLACATAVAAGQAPVPPDAAGSLYEMNGIRLQDYQNFQVKWRPVTVRFRSDTGEMRFTFANDIAYDALLKKVKDYPDGAVFAKIGVITADDPEFASSKVPSGAQRIQFMVRNKHNYAATGGWGYALFAPAGMRLDKATPPEQQAAACDVCHQLVKDSRGEVFSQPINLLSTEIVMPLPDEVPKIPEVAFSYEQAVFKNYPVASLPKPIRELLPEVKSVRFLKGTLRNHVFAGTLNELHPFLIRETGRTHIPTLFLAKDNVQFALIVPVAAQDKSLSCPSDAKPFKIYESIRFEDHLVADNMVTHISSTCFLP